MLKNILKRVNKKAGRFFNALTQYSGKDLSSLLKDEEAQRISALPRRTESTTQLFQKTISFPDGYWFLHSLSELFVEEVYKFRSANSSPYIIDCGANIGLSVLYFKKQNPEANVLAFEPDKNIYARMSENLRQFNFANVELRNKGVWKEETTLSFIAEGTLGGRVLDDERVEASRLITIETVRLRDYLQKPVDFLKLDIEGAEYEVLNDCADSLRNVALLFVEYHSQAGKPQKLSEILSIVRDAGFRYYVREASQVVSFPFTEVKRSGFDLQLNIFCYRL